MADAAERSLGNSTWRESNAAAGTEYLTLLVAHTGYQLSAIEVTAMKATNPTWTPPKESSTRTATTAGSAKRAAAGGGTPFLSRRWRVPTHRALPRRRPGLRPRVPRPRRAPPAPHPGPDGHEAAEQRPRPVAGG